MDSKTGYRKQTKYMSLVYNHNNDSQDVVSYSNAYWAANKVDRNSISGSNY